MARINRVNPINRRKFLQMSAGLTGLAATLTACGGNPTPTPAPAEAKPTEAPAAAVPAADSTVDKSKLAKELSWYTWGGYWSDDVLKKFTAEFGVKIKADTFSSNEELEAKFKAGGNPGYDLITPSDYMVSKLITAGLVEKINFANIPNVKNLDPGHIKLYFDPTGEYSVAYNWGSTGLAYDKTKVKEPITSWKQIMEWPAELKGKLGLLDDVRETMAVPLRYKGFSGNTDNPDEINTAKQLLIDLKKKANYTMADSPTNKTNLVAGDVVAAQIYTNDAVTARTDNPNIVYVIPTEVSTIWQDNVCVPKGAPSPYTAEVFINFLLRPEISAQMANEVGLSTPNAETLKQGLIDKKLADDKTVYIDIAGMGNHLDYLRKGNPKVDQLYLDAFQAVKAAS